MCKRCRACQSAKIAGHTPHAYRHRWISLALKRGLPIADVCAAAGQSDRSVALNTYTHVHGRGLTARSPETSIERGRSRRMSPRSSRR